MLPRLSGTPDEVAPIIFAAAVPTALFVADELLLRKGDMKEKLAFFAVFCCSELGWIRLEKLGGSGNAGEAGDGDPGTEAKLLIENTEYIPRMLVWLALLCSIGTLLEGNSSTASGSFLIILLDLVPFLPQLKR